MRLIQIVAGAHASHSEATLSGAVMCVLLLAVLPAVVGYVLLLQGASSGKSIDFALTGGV